jgi:DNA-binding transcriptional MerR regulator
MHSIEAVCLAGCTTRRGVRHWEDSGLLGKVQRTDGNTRRYTDEQIDLARIIAAAQFGGWSLEEIKAMLAEWGDEAYEAITVRLSQQIQMAIRLVEALPKKGTSGETLEFDL